MSDDPRMGAPSCSALARLEACPGSWWLTKDLPETSGPDAISGTKIHRWLETQMDDDWKLLTMSEQDTALNLWDKARAEIGEDGVDIEQREIRYWLNQHKGQIQVNYTPQNPGALISGQADVVVEYLDGRILILDYKSGRGEQVEAANNAQLRGLAALASYIYQEAPSIDVVIISPRKTTRASFGRKQFPQLKDWLNKVLLWIVFAQDKPEQQLKAGDHCHYCKMNAQCETFMDAVKQQADLLKIDDLPLNGQNANAKLFGRATNLAPERIAEALDNLHLLTWYQSAIKSAAKRMLENGIKVPGWSLAETKGNRAIVDASIAAESLAGHLDQAEIIAACKMSPSKLTDALRKASGLKDGGLRYNLSAGKAKDMLHDLMGDNMIQESKTTLKKEGFNLEV